MAESYKEISICQTKYCMDPFNDTSMMGCKPTITPMDYKWRLYQTNNSPKIELKFNGLSDANWGTCKDTTRPISENYFFLAESIYYII